MRLKHMSINQTMTVKELASELKVHTNTVYKWVDENKVPFIRVGTQYRFFLGEVIDELRK